jgi:hypothetical protein
MTTKASVQSVAARPSTGGIIGALVYWVVAIVLVILMTPTAGIPGWLWAVRIIVPALGAIYAVCLIIFDSSVQRDNTAFDLWTIAHTTAGLAMGLWGVPFWLVAIFTVGWEIFEWQVPGFGDGEIFWNRVVDIAVAWVGWLICAGIVAGAASIPIPFLLPSVGSILRNS